MSLKRRDLIIAAGLGATATSFSGFVDRLNKSTAVSQKLKEGLSQMSHVTLYTPRDDNLCAGIVCFDVDGLSPSQVVSQLKKRKIIASITPYSPSYARLTPGVYNTPQQMDRVLAAIQELT
jgi:isopenicillin-N epimerase